MADQFQTSFIPKKTVVQPVRVRKTGIGFVMFIAVLFFVLSIIGAVGVFLYKQVLEDSIQSKRNTLQSTQEAFDPGTIRVLSRLATRIEEGGNILDAHIAPSGLFTRIAETTLETVQFTSFNFAPQEDGVLVSMSGVAPDFASIALQADVFGAAPDIHSSIFSGLSVNEFGDVSFSFSAVFDYDIVAYGGDALENTNTQVPSSDDTTTPGVDGGDAVQGSDDVTTEQQ